MLEEDKKLEKNGTRNIEMQPIRLNKKEYKKLKSEEDLQKKHVKNHSLVDQQPVIDSNLIWALTKHNWLSIQMKYLIQKRLITTLLVNIIKIISNTLHLLELKKGMWDHKKYNKKNKDRPHHLIPMNWNNAKPTRNTLNIKESKWNKWKMN